MAPERCRLLPEYKLNTFALQKIIYAHPWFILFGDDGVWRREQGGPDAWYPFRSYCAKIDHVLYVRTLVLWRSWYDVIESAHCGHTCIP